MDGLGPLKSTRWGLFPKRRISMASNSGFQGRTRPYFFKLSLFFLQ